MFVERDLVAGGSPWRLLRLPGASATVVERWRAGATVLAGQENLARTLVQQGVLHADYVATFDLTDVDVVVPTIGEVAQLERLLKELQILQVTVVDDGSRDPGAVEQITNRYGVRLVRLAHNGGPAAARNAGVAATRRPFVLFVDVDITFPAVVQTLESLLVGFADPLVAAVAPRIKGAMGPGWRSEFESRHCPLDLGQQSGLVVPRARVSYVPSAALLVRRIAFGDGFDVSMRVGEDVDFVWRLHDAGWLVRYDASQVVFHDARDSWVQWWNQRMGYGRSANVLAARHGDRVTPVAVDIWTLASWVAAVWGRPRWAMTAVSVARRGLVAQLPPSTTDPDRVANQIVVRGIFGAGAPLARAVTRSYGPVLLLAMLHPKLRRVALTIGVVGTAWRWRHQPALVAGDIPLAVADDLAYATGLWSGAWREKSTRALRPKISISTAGLRSIGAKSPVVAPRLKRETQRRTVI